MAIEWTEDLATGIEKIDDQHKEIFVRVRALVDAGKQGKGRQTVAETLDFLVDYVRTHFAAEEAIQKESAYPDFNSHKAQHTEFLKNIDKLKVEFDEEGPTLSVMLKVNQVVVEWLVAHIKRVDKALAEFLRKNR